MCVSLSSSFWKQRISVVLISVDFTDETADDHKNLLL